MAWWPENLTDWVVIISGIATTVLVIIVGRQLVITKKEIDSRTRPWVAPIALNEDYLVYPNGSQEPYDVAMAKHEKNPDVKFKQQIDKLVIKNFGALPARVGFRFEVQTKKITKAALQSKDFTKHLTIMPGAEEYAWPKYDYGTLLKGVHYWVGLETEYDVSGKKSRSGKIWEISEKETFVRDSW